MQLLKLSHSVLTVACNCLANYIRLSNTYEDNNETDKQHGNRQTT